MSARRSLAFAMLIVLLASGVVGAHAPHAPQAPQEPVGSHGVGMVQSRVTMLSAGLDVAGQRTDAALGTVIAAASTRDTPAAALLVEGLRARDAQAKRRYDSADGPQRGTVAFPLSSPGVTGELRIVDYAVEAGARRALARAGALDANLDVLSLAALADSGQRGLEALVDDQRVSGTGTVSLSGLRITLADLLGIEVLERLPLGAVLGLLDLVELDLSGRLGREVRSVTDLVDALGLIPDARAAVSDARDELHAIVGSGSGVGEARDAVDAASASVDSAAGVLASATDQAESTAAALADAQAALADAETALATLTAEIDALATEIAELQALYDSLHPVLDALERLELSERIDGLQSQLDGLTDDVPALEAARDAAAAAAAEAQAAHGEAEAVVARAQGRLDDANAALDGAEAELRALLEAAGRADEDAAVALARLDDARSRLTELLETVGDQLGSLPDLADLRDDLVGVLGGVRILEMDALRMGVEAVADASDARASVDCGATEVRLLGQRIASPSCGVLRERLEPLAVGLEALLAGLPIELTGDLPVIVEGLEVTEQAGMDEHGRTGAIAAVSALRIAVPGLRLVGLGDELTGELLAHIDDLTSDAPAAAGLSALALGGLGVSLPAGLGDALGELEDTLGGLPDGQALAGLDTTGVDLRIAGVRTEALYDPVAATAGPSDPDPAGDGSPGGGGDDGPDDGGPGTPANPPPGSPAHPSPWPVSPGPDLPKTGGGALAGGVAALLGGLALWPGRRRPRGGPSRAARAVCPFSPTSSPVKVPSATVSAGCSAQ